MKITFNIILGLVSVLVLGCTATPAITASSTELSASEQSFIVTYLVSIEKKRNDIGDAFYECILVNQVKKSGYLKTRVGFEVEDNHHHDELSFVFKDKNGQKVTETKLANPLIKHFEVPSEAGNIEKKTVHLDKEVVGVRVNYHPSIEFIQVLMIDENQKMEIATLAVNQK